jgi:branched-chain amino acid transport system permease protein
MVDQLVVSTLEYGNVIALMSVALTLTYMSTKIPNFAHGDYATVGSYAAYTVWVLLMRRVDIPGVMYMLAPLGALVSAATAYASYVLVFRPLIRRGASIIILMVSSFALTIFMSGFLNSWASVLEHDFDVIATGVFVGTDFVVLNDIPGLLIVSTVIVTVVTALLYYLLYHTRFGAVVRASVDNPDLARAMGIDVESVYARVWLIIGALTGTAGVLIVGGIATLSPSTGFNLVLLFFAAAIVGGLENPWGALVGSYIISGGTIYLGSLVLPPNYSYLSPVIPFSLIVITLMLAPEGLLSRVIKA